MIAKWRWASLSARLLLLTVFFVMLAEVLIYAPSAGRFRLMYLQDRLADAHLAALSLDAAPGGQVRPTLEAQLLLHVGAHAVDVRRIGSHWTKMLSGSIPPPIDATYYLREGSLFSLIWDAFVTLAHSKGRVLQVTGPSPTDSSVIVEVIMDEAPMRAALIRYSGRILQLSLIISGITAALVYLSLQWLIVRPMGHLTESMLRFRDRPEDETVDVGASRRGDEIGVAQRVLADMQAALRQALTQRAHLASLGEAVVKINHDLRNILASAQIVSDRLAASEDPRVRAEAPVLLQAIDRAVALCSQVVLFAQSRRPRLRPADVEVRDLMEEVGDNVLAQVAPREKVPPKPLRWENRIAADILVRGDRAQLLRLFENIARNAFEAGATEIVLSAEPVSGFWAVMVDDNGPGLPKHAQQHLFEPFRSSARPGGTGLGLAIARELAVAHGGHLRLDRTGIEGTCFTIELPMASSAIALWRKSA